MWGHEVHRKKVRKVVIFVSPVDMMVQGLSVGARMKLYTSHFRCAAEFMVRGCRCISIARWATSWRGEKCLKLAPDPGLLRRFKGGEISQATYVERYREETLAGLDAKELADELGDGSILLCFEPPERFCHRMVVAEWFKSAGVDVEEIGVKNEDDSGS